MAENTCMLAVPVVPNAPRNEIVGWLGDALKVRVQAPPAEGRANAGLCEFLAAKLGVSRRDVVVARGETSRRKIIRITGFTLADARAALGRGP